MEKMKTSNRQTLMVLQERLATLLEFAEKVNIVTQQCIEAERNDDKEAELRAVEEIERLDEELDNILTAVTQAEIDEITHVLSEESLLANVDWLRKCSKKLDILADEYAEAIKVRHDVKRAASIRQDIKNLGHALVRGKQV